MVNGDVSEAKQSSSAQRSKCTVLFGRNVTGGAVLLRTQRPSHDAGARFRGIVGSDDRYEAAVTLCSLSKSTTAMRAR